MQLVHGPFGLAEDHQVLRCRCRGDAALLRLGRLVETPHLAMRGRIRQAVAKGKQRVVAGSRPVQRGLARGPRPGDDSVPVKSSSLCRRSWRNSRSATPLALGARQPGGHERVGAVSSCSTHSGRPERNTVTTGRAFPATRSQHREVLRMAAALFQRAERLMSPLPFRVRRSRRSRRSTASNLRRVHALAVSRCTSRCRRPAASRRPPRIVVAVREVGVGVAGALPGQRPAAGLVAACCRRSCRPPAPSRRAAAAAGAASFLSSTSDSRTACARERARLQRVAALPA